MEPIICLHCYEVLEAKYCQTLLGFRKYACPTCGKTSIYPLPDTYRWIYWGVITIVGIFSAIAFAQGRIAVPGLLCIAGIISLINDAKIKRHVSRVQEDFMRLRAEKKQQPTNAESL